MNIVSKIFKAFNQFVAQKDHKDRDA